MKQLELNESNKKTENVLVSVIVATFKRDVSLERAIDSIIKQTYNSIEIIVVDDNANIRWNNKVKGIVNRMNQIRPIVYIKNEMNMGSAETRNIGIKKASGEYITFLDDDDIYLPNKVKNQLHHMLEEGSDYSVTDLFLYDETDKLIEKRKRTYLRRNKQGDLLKYHLMYHITGTDTMMFKRGYLLNLGGFPKINIGDEFYLMQNAIHAGGGFSYLAVSDIKAYVHTDTEGLSSGEGKIKGENALFEYKKEFFTKLSKKEIRYIKMRHYAVLAFAEMRRKNTRPFLKNSVLSFVSSPTGFLRLFLNTF